MEQAAPTSMMVFRQYLVYGADDGIVDASRVHSPECFRAWRLTRGLEATPQSCKKFYRALTNHLSGVDGRFPFTPEEEAAICQVLRTPGLWPCFPEGTKLCTTGYRGFGFHEKAQAKQLSPLASLGSQALGSSVSPPPKRLMLCTDDWNLSQEERHHIDEFVGLLDSFLVNVGPDAAESATHELFRMLLYTRYPCVSRSADSRTAEALCAQLPASDVGLVFDFTERNFDARIKAQNAQSVLVLGNLVGKSHSFCGKEDLRAVFREALVALHKPGVPVVVPFVSVSTATGEEILMEVSYSFEPGTLLCSCVATRIDLLLDF